MKLPKVSLLFLTAVTLSACGSAEQTSTDNVEVVTETVTETVVLESEVTEIEVIVTESIETEQLEVETETVTQQSYEDATKELVETYAEENGLSYDEAYEEIFGPSSSEHGNMITADDPRVDNTVYSDDEMPDWMTDELLDLGDGFTTQ